MASPPSRSAVLALFRAVVRTANAFPNRSIAKKLVFNARELIRLRRDERDADAIASAIADGHAALRVYALLQRDATLRAAITRKASTTDMS